MPVGKKMFIGELSRLTGLKPKTIRFYEEVGLLPEPRRSEGNYRLYPPDAVEQLRFVRTAQRLGLKLTEIRGIIRHSRQERPPCDYVGQLVKEKIARLDEEMEKLLATRQRLAEVLNLWEQTRDQPGSSPSNVICPCIEEAAL